MHDDKVMDLEDCTEFRQTLLARPPAIVHGTVLLLLGLLGTGVGWAAVTEANLVVRAPGHVRPVSAPRQVFIDFHSDQASAGSSVAVVEVKYKQGDEVKEGDVLIRLDTRRLDTEIKKREVAIREGEKELAQLSEQKKLLAQQFEKAKAETVAEVTQVAKEIERAKSQQTLDVEMAQKELKFAQQKLARGEQLMRTKAISVEEFEELTLRVRKAEGELKKFQLPILAEKLEVSQRKQERLQKDHLLKQLELQKEQTNKLREVEIARMERDRLEIERRQAVVYAPINGIVTSREVKVGDIPEPGKAVVEIAEQKGFRFEVAISSEDVAHLRSGMPARLKLDAFDYQKYGVLDGTVCFIAPDSKVVEGQRVAKYVVMIELEGDEVGRGALRGRIKLGMAGQVDIVTDQESLLTLLATRLRQTFSLD